MIYPGLKDEQKTNDLVAFLKQFDADGKKNKAPPLSPVVLSGLDVPHEQDDNTCAAAPRLPGACHPVRTVSDRSFCWARSMPGLPSLSGFRFSMANCRCIQRSRRATGTSMKCCSATCQR